jgi:hypothetical protein
MRLLALRLVVAGAFVLAFVAGASEKDADAAAAEDPDSVDNRQCNEPDEENCPWCLSEAEVADPATIVPKNKYEMFRKCV